jgi:hypothetical protein
LQFSTVAHLGKPSTIFFKMTEYTPRNRQELNSLLANAHMVLPHYSNNGGASYIYGNGHVPYTAINAVYPTYTTTYSPNNNITHFTPESSQMAVQYQQNPTHVATSLSPRSTVAQAQYLAPQSSMPQYSYANRAVLSRDSYSLIDTEDQDSANRESMLSEPISPVLEGYPDVHEFDVLMAR